MNNFIIQRRFSRITSITPDRNDFPLYYESYKLEFVINEGECLFIPNGWYHYVLSEDVNKDTSLNIAISHFMKSPVNDYQLSTDLDYYINNIKKYNLLYDNNKDDINNIIKLHKTDSVPFTCINMSKTDITINDLQNIFNNDELLINSSINNFFTSNYIKEFNPKNCVETYMKFNDFLNMNKKITDYNYYLIQENEKYLNSIGIPSFIHNLKNRNLWINFGNVYTVLHYDCYDNFLWQIQGKKRIILYPPSERNKLYMYNPYPLEFLYRRRYNR